MQYCFWSRNLLYSQRRVTVFWTHGFYWSYCGPHHPESDDIYITHISFFLLLNNINSCWAWWHVGGRGRSDFQIEFQVCQCQVVRLLLTWINQSVNQSFKNNTKYSQMIELPILINYYTKEKAIQHAGRWWELRESEPGGMSISMNCCSGRMPKRSLIKKVVSYQWVHTMYILLCTSKKGYLTQDIF